MTDSVLPPSAESVLALARTDLACYATANYPAFELPPFLDLVVTKLEAVERGDIRRLILSMPPRHGKSLTASTYFPAWYLGRHPDRYVIAASYGQDLADDFGRRVRNTVNSPLHRSIFPESRVADDSAAIHRFNMSAGGAYYAVGRGAAITGRGATLAIVDDPIKDMEEALSPTIRRSLHQWFSTVLYTRLMPDAAVVLTQTRWHEDDLAGWLLREFAAEGWEVLSLPAIAEANDPIGRAEGQALWPESVSDRSSRKHPPSARLCRVRIALSAETGADRRPDVPSRMVANVQRFSGIVPSHRSLDRLRLQERR